MQDFENMYRKEAIAMCKTLWQKKMKKLKK